MAAIRICLINQKGGCGKSSTCFHLSGSFAASGMSVLLIDADPQGSLSQAFLGSDENEKLLPSETLAALFDDSCFFVDPKETIRPTGIQGVSLTPANHHLAKYNSPEPEEGGINQFVLRDFLKSQSEFDVVLIDWPRRKSLHMK